MRRSAIKLLGVVVVAVLVFAAVTLIALEGREVVVLRTRDAGGAVHETRTWIAESEGALWVEAANESRPFLTDVRAHPELELRRGGTSHRCRVTPLPNPEGHRRIRSLLAERYGWADAWIGLLADTSASVALRLDCGTD